MTPPKNYLSIPDAELSTSRRDALNRFRHLTEDLRRAWDEVRRNFGEPIEHDCDLCKGSGKMALFGTEEDCDACKGTGKSKTPFPLVLTGIDTSRFKGLHTTRRTGWVKIRPCGEEYGNKTYLGWYLGDMAVGVQAYVKEGDLTLLSHNNPAIFVPELGKVIFGCESWWGNINSPADLADITDADINSVWYVQALKDLGSKPEEV